MGRFAENTTVEVAKSQGEIIAMVTRRGAKEFASGRMDGREFVAFVYKDFPVKLQCPAIDPRKIRTPEAVDQEKRRQWRVMLLWCKAQIEAIDNGLLEPFAVFMPYIQLADGRTVSESVSQDGMVKMLAGTLHLSNVPALTGPVDEPEQIKSADVVR